MAEQLIPLLDNRAPAMQPELPINIEQRFIPGKLLNYNNCFRICGGSEHGQLLTVEVYGVYEQRRRIPRGVGENLHLQNMSSRFLAHPSDIQRPHLVDGDILIKLNGFPVSGLRSTEFKAFFDFKIKTCDEIVVDVLPAGQISIRLQDIMRYSDVCDGVTELKAIISWNIRRNNKPFKAFLFGPGSSNFDHLFSDSGDNDYNIIPSKEFLNSIDAGRMIEYGWTGTMYGTRTPYELCKTYYELTENEIRTYFAEPVSYERRQSFNKALGFRLQKNDDESLQGNVYERNRLTAEVISTQTNQYNLKPTFTIEFDESAVETMGGWFCLADGTKIKLIYKLQRNPVGPIFRTIIFLWTSTEKPGYEQNGVLVAAIGRLPWSRKDIQNRTGHNPDLSILFRLRHSNIARYYGMGDIKSRQKRQCLLMDNAEWGALQQFKSLRQDAKMRILAQVSCGLEYLHNKLIVHGDLNSGNILLTGMNGDPLIYGLESCTQLEHEKHFVEIPAGGPLYMSPEMIRLSVAGFFQSSETVNRATDIWSFGCICYEMLLKSGQLPYQLIIAEPAVYAMDYQVDNPVDAEIRRIIKYLPNLERSQMWKAAFFEVSGPIKGILESCLEYNQLKRTDSTKLTTKMNPFQEQIPNDNLILDLIRHQGPPLALNRTGPVVSALPADSWK